MGKILVALIVVVCTTFIFGVKSEGRSIAKRAIIEIDTNGFLEFACKNSLANVAPALCDAILSSSNSSTTTTAATTTTVSTTDDDDHDDDDDDDVASVGTTSTTSTSTAESTTAMSATALERAHWCSFGNGSYVALNQTFMYSACTICRCTPSRAFLCAKLQCMATYCIDGTTPTVKNGQCCPQCAYENTSNTCVFNDMTVPHGVRLLQTTSNLQCWCQSGNIECRKSSASLFSGLDYWGDGTAVYVIVIVICVVLMLGTLLCCGCTVFFYYYYKKNQPSVQEAYAQYYQNAGWQPMAEDGQVIADKTAEEKQAEADQQQYEYENSVANTEQYIPPPYALYNGNYVDGQNEKH